MLMSEETIMATISPRFFLGIAQNRLSGDGKPVLHNGENCYPEAARL